MGFEGKAVVVTGGTQGVGRETAKLLARRGARGVAICGRSAANGSAVADEIKELGARAAFFEADLAAPEDCFKVIDGASDAFGGLDCLVNCCGATDRGTLESTTPLLWDYLFAVNVRAPFFLAQRIVPNMRAHGRGGTITSIGSVAAYAWSALHYGLQRGEGGAADTDQELGEFPPVGQDQGERPQHRMDRDTHGA